MLYLNSSENKFKSKTRKYRTPLMLGTASQMELIPKCTNSLHLKAMKAECIWKTIVSIKTNELYSL